MYIGSKVGEFSVSQRQKLSPNLEVEEIFEGDIYLEQAHQTQNEINESFKNFASKYGITEDVTSKEAKRTTGQQDETITKI